MRAKIDAIATIVMCLAALFVAGMVGFRKAPSARRGLIDIPYSATPVANWDTLVRAGIRVGDPNSRVTIVEFADFECPFCARFSESINQVEAEFGKDVSHVFVHYPLRSHRFARPAARAAECASAQGHFKSMQDVLFAKQDSLGLKSWVSYAAEAGVLDTASFSHCASDAKPLASVEEGLRLGAGLGVTGTPTVIINGLRYSSPPGDSLSAIVRAALAR